MKKKRLNLGDFCFQKKRFKNLKDIFKPFFEKEFLKKNLFEKENIVNKVLFELIYQEEKISFCLPQVIDYIEEIKSKNVLNSYDFSSFELWLNHYSKLSFERNYEIRAKIAGKYIPREEYQKLFPIGMQKIYEGSHIVTAHRSADIDSCLSSFWSWLDSFAARVSLNLHIWNVPDGFYQPKEMDIFFENIFSKKVFDSVLKTDSILTLTSKDLVSVENLIIKKESDTTSIVDHKRYHNAVVVVDKNGYYVGEWRSFDVEDIMKVLSLLSRAITWFKNKIQLDLISLLAKENFDLKRIKRFAVKIFEIKIKDFSIIKEYNERKKIELESFLKKVLKIKDGLNSSFENFSKTLSKFSLNSFEEIYLFFKNLKKEDFYENKEESRAKSFKFFEKILRKLNFALEELERYFERMDIALKIKSEIFKYKPCYVNITDDVEEIKNKMGPRQFLCVVIGEKNKKVPIGIIKASDLKKNYLGTISFRDFCDKEEVQISSYLDIISVIDHHKAKLETRTPPLAMISDAQATSTILAKTALEINEKYSLCNIEKQDVDFQIDKKKTKSFKILKNLLQKKLIIERKDNFFIHPEREFLEYLHYIYAILDDTDLLMKVSKIDVEVVSELLNKMKSILLKKEVEIIDLETIKKNENFTSNSAKYILQNEDMYSIYKEIYLQKEKEVKKNIISCIKGSNSFIFADTKVQNKCCRVGQIKMFSKNVLSFEKYKYTLLKRWIEQSLKVYEDRNTIDLHIQMISTIRGAEEVFRGSYKKYTHKDEIWLWIPQREVAKTHFKKFANSFIKILKKVDKNFEVELLGKDLTDLEKIFYKCNILKTKKLKKEFPYNVAILKYKAGSVNSRKAMVSPYLPTLII